MADDLNRDKFYGHQADDDDELELEPPDPDVLAAEKRRGEDAMAELNRTIDIDEIYREAERSREAEILEGWLHGLRGKRAGFQFQIKHLLFLTALLAIVLTLIRLRILGTALVVLVMVGVAALTLYLQWQEKKRRDEADRRRRQIYAERRAHLNRQRAVPRTQASEPAPSPDRKTLTAEAPDDAVKKAARPVLRFQFSLRQLMIAMVVAAIVLGLIQVVGGPQNAATMCGMVALVGLVVHAVGFEPPEIVVFGWWILLLLYVTLSIAAAIWSAF
jgi:hypothetical protein